jgi:uncharacterized membrane protein
MLRPRVRPFWLRLPEGLRFLTRSGVRALLAAVVGVLAGWLLLLADQAAGLTLPTSIEAAQALMTALVSGMVTLAVFALWMRSIVAGLAAGHVSPRIVSSYLDDRFQWHLLTGMAAGVTFTATVLVGLPMENQEDAPALSVVAAGFALVLGLVMVLFALREGVRRLDPPRVVYTLAHQARHAMTSDGVPDDRWPEDRARLPEQVRHHIAAEDMGWVTWIDHQRLLDGLPEGAHLGLYVDVGAFVAHGDPSAACDQPLDARTADRLRAGIVVQAVRSPDTDLGFALQQLRDLASRSLRSSEQDTSTAFEALLYLRAVLGELITLDEPSGDALGTDGRAVTSAARRRVHDHVQETLEPLVHAAGSDPLAARDLRMVLDDLIGEAEAARGPSDPEEVLRRLVYQRDVLDAATTPHDEDAPLSSLRRDGAGLGTKREGQRRPQRSLDRAGG